MAFKRGKIISLAPRGIKYSGTDVKFRVIMACCICRPKLSIAPQADLFVDPDLRCS